jgi:hypothetical protein
MQQFRTLNVWMKLGWTVGTESLGAVHNGTLASRSLALLEFEIIKMRVPAIFAAVSRPPGAGDA